MGVAIDPELMPAVDESTLASGNQAKTGVAIDPDVMPEAVRRPAGFWSEFARGIIEPTAAAGKSILGAAQSDLDEMIGLEKEYNRSLSTEPTTAGTIGGVVGGIVGGATEAIGAEAAGTAAASELGPAAPIAGLAAVGGAFAATGARESLARTYSTARAQGRSPSEAFELARKAQLTGAIVGGATGVAFPGAVGGTIERVAGRRILQGAIAKGVSPIEAQTLAREAGAAARSAAAILPQSGKAATAAIMAKGAVVGGGATAIDNLVEQQLGLEVPSYEGIGQQALTMAGVVGLFHAWHAMRNRAIEAAQTNPQLGRNLERQADQQLRAIALLPEFGQGTMAEQALKMLQRSEQQGPQAQRTPTRRTPIILGPQPAAQPDAIAAIEKMLRYNAVASELDQVQRDFGAAVDRGDNAEIARLNDRFLELGRQLQVAKDDLSRTEPLLLTQGAAEVGEPETPPQPTTPQPTPKTYETAEETEPARETGIPQAPTEVPAQGSQAIPEEVTFPLQPGKTTAWADAHGRDVELVGNKYVFKTTEAAPARAPTSEEAAATPAATPSEVGPGIEVRTEGAEGGAISPEPVKAVEPSTQPPAPEAPTVARTGETGKPPEGGGPPVGEPTAAQVAPVEATVKGALEGEPPLATFEIRGPTPIAAKFERAKVTPLIDEYERRVREAIPEFVKQNPRGPTEGLIEYRKRMRESIPIRPEDVPMLEQIISGLDKNILAIKADIATESGARTRKLLENDLRGVRELRDRYQKELNRVQSVNQTLQAEAEPPTPPPSAKSATVETAKAREPWEMTKQEWSQHEAKGTWAEFEDEPLRLARERERQAIADEKTATANREKLGSVELIRKVMDDRSGALERNQARRDADKAVADASDARRRASRKTAAMSQHESFVRRAIERGDAVPPEVLAEYPDLSAAAKAKTSEGKEREISATPEADVLLKPPATKQSLTADIRGLLHRVELLREEQKHLIPKGKRTKLSVSQRRQWDEIQSKIDSANASVKVLEGVRAGLEPPTAPPAEAKGISIKLDKSEAGFVNADILKDVVDFGRSIYQKGMDFARWSAEMVNHLGEKVRAYLATAWDHIQNALGLDYLTEAPRLGRGAEPLTEGKSEAGMIGLGQRPTPEQADIERLRGETVAAQRTSREAWGNNVAERWATLTGQLGSWRKRAPTKAEITRRRDAADSIANMSGDVAHQGVLFALPGTRKGESAYVTKTKDIAASAVKAAEPRGGLAYLENMLAQGNAARIKDKHWRDAMVGIRYAVDHWNDLLEAVNQSKVYFDNARRAELQHGFAVGFMEGYVPGRGEPIWTDGGFFTPGRSGGRGFMKSKHYTEPFEALFARDKALFPGEGYTPKSLELSKLTGSRIRQGAKLVEMDSWTSMMKGVTDPATGRQVATNMLRKYNEPKQQWDSLENERNRLQSELRLLTATQSRQEAASRRIANIESRLGELDATQAALEAQHGNLKDAKLWESTVPSREYEPFEIAPGRTMAVLRDYLPLIRALTGRGGLSESAVGRTLLKSAYGLKSGLLMLDTFHAGRMLQMLGATGLGRAGYAKGASLLEFDIPTLRRAVEQGMAPADAVEYATTPITLRFGDTNVTQTRHEWVRDLLRSGMNAARIQDALYNEFVRSIPGIGAVNRWVFDKLTRGAMAEVGLVELERLNRAYPNLTLPQLRAKVASDINVMFGSLGRQGIIKNQTLREIAQVLFLAPQWVESLATKEAKFLWRGANVPFNLARTGQPGLYTLGQGMGTGLAVYVGITQLLNYIFRNKSTIDNEEPGHKMDAWIPDLTGKTNGFFFSPLSVFAEISHDIVRYAETKPSMADALAQIGENKLSPLARSIIVLAGGRDPMSAVKLPTSGQRVATATATLVPLPIGLSPLGRAAAHAAAPSLVAAPVPGAVQRQATASLGFKTEPAASYQGQVRQFMRSWMEQSVDPKVNAKLEREQEYEFGTSPYSDLRRALRSEDYATAMIEYGKLLRLHSGESIQKAMTSSRPFTGSNEMEGKFRASLTPNQKEIYKQAIAERRDMGKRFTQLLKLIRQAKPSKQP